MTITSVLQDMRENRSSRAHTLDKEGVVTQANHPQKATVVSRETGRNVSPRFAPGIKPSAHPSTFCFLLAFAGLVATMLLAPTPESPRPTVLASRYRAWEAGLAENCVRAVPIERVLKLRGYDLCSGLNPPLTIHASATIDLREAAMIPSKQVPSKCAVDREFIDSVLVMASLLLLLLAAVMMDRLLLGALIFGIVVFQQRRSVSYDVQCVRMSCPVVTKR